MAAASLPLSLIFACSLAPHFSVNKTRIRLALSRVENSTDTLTSGANCIDPRENGSDMGIGQCELFDFVDCAIQLSRVFRHFDLLRFVVIMCGLISEYGSRDDSGAIIGVIQLAMAHLGCLVWKEHVQSEATPQ